MDWDSEDEGNTDPFFGLREPFSGLNEMDFELHGIYMDHEPDEEFVTPLDKFHNGYQLYFEKCDSTRILVRCGKRNEDNGCRFRLKFKLGSMFTPEWIGRHYITEIANKPKVKLKEMITNIRQRFRCAVSIGQCRRAKKWAKELIKDGINNFHRFYIGFKDICEGWKNGCKRVIGLEGCFLKGAVNWTWFLELLRDDLDLDSGRGLVVISDQHKGLLESMKDILPHVEHRNCVMHIYANFRKTFTGLEYKKLFWAASISCTQGDFKRHMESIKKLNPSTYEYLMSKQPKTWSRAYFGSCYTCEAVEKGTSGCFNSIILDARRKPLITMLEEIRIYIMDRLWDLADIPCVHTNASINFIHQTPDAYINAYFSKEKFRQCYSTNIEPVNVSNLWAQTEYIKPLPLMSRRMPGRPATKRKRHVSEKESKISTTKVKVAITTRCGNCLEYGHNKRACKNERKQYVPPPPTHQRRQEGQENIPSPMYLFLTSH
ncbi:unnamed protein product [Lactuca saligna]|uniref:Uncharacterized protein n=1 Tax=Lactuca saligna TaxID=75948 RepID=A0AA36EBB4_LACSI|nr:unnamed protein product [Lactuca saligna]